MRKNNIRMEATNLNQLMSIILLELQSVHAWRMSDEALADIKAFAAGQHDPGETYDYIKKGKSNEMV